VTALPLGDTDGDGSDDDVVPDYAESARSYRSLVYTGIGLLIGFGIDCALSVHGAVTHLPGWILIGAILLGIHVLLVYAVRATKSLTLTADELRIGDEVLPRPDIVGVNRERLETAPVLGWPNGMPRGVASITVRLADDRDVVVPTRHPERLEAVLGVGVAVPRDEPLLRVADADDLPLLADIDARADAIFRVAGYDLPQLEFDEDGLDDAALVLVIDRPPVGFVRVDELEGRAHIEQLAVLPSSMRRGYGSQLVEQACDWARGAGYPAITLITYADVPWNGPFYATRGFVELDVLTPGLVSLRSREQSLGLDAVGRRIVMSREL
jgi:GNAT superfamily N-acetyltransferase